MTTSGRLTYRHDHQVRIRNLVVTAFLLVCVPAALMLITGLADMRVHGLDSLLEVLRPDPTGATWTLALVGTSEGVAIAIVIVVVVLGIQLSADRYSPRVIEIFIRDPLNTAVIGLFLSSIVYDIWITTEVKENFVPHVGLYTSVALAFIDFSLLLPYLRHIFGIMRGEMIIGSVHHDAGNALQAELRGSRSLQRRHDFRESLDQLTDIILGAITEGDTELGVKAIDVLRRLLVEEYMPNKAKLKDVWFRVGHEDMLGVAPEVIEEVDASRVWVEYKVMSRLLALIGETPSFRKEVIQAIASTTRGIAIAGARCDDEEVIDLAMRFMNTYLRAAINQRAPQFAYVIMAEYRRLVIELGDRRPTLVLAVAEHLLRYGQAFENAGMPFPVGTAAEDVADLARHSARTDPPMAAKVAGLLGQSLLNVHKGGHPSARAGMLASVLKLALAAEAEGWTPVLDSLVATLRELPSADVDAVLDRMQVTEEWRFWEITDRVATFHYVPPELRKGVPDLRRKILQGREATVEKSA